MLSFSDKEQPLEGSAHNKLLYISVEYMEKWVPMLLLDTSSAVNVCPSRTAYVAGLKSEEFFPTA